MSHVRLKAVFFSLASLAALTFCSSPTDNRDGVATLMLTADVTGTAVATVVVEVTAPDIPTSLVFNIPIVNQLAAGTITIPAGSGRTIEIEAYDAGGVKTHQGSATVSLQPGANPTLPIVLQPLVGDVVINATLGHFTVAVTPAVVNLTVAGTAPLTATIHDWNGTLIAGTVSWATHDPGIATVDNTGVITATGAGTTTISAMYQGATGVATVNVTAQ